MANKPAAAAARCAGVKLSGRLVQVQHSAPNHSLPEPPADNVKPCPREAPSLRGCSSAPYIKAPAKSHMRNTATTTSVQVSSGVWSWRAPPVITARGSLDVGAIASYVRPDNLWETAAAGAGWWCGMAARRQRLKAAGPLPPPPDLAASRMFGGRPLEGAAGASSGLNQPAVPGQSTQAGVISPADAISAKGSVDGASVPMPSLAPAAWFQLDVHATVSADSKFELLGQDDSVAVRLSGTGVTLSVATGSPGGTSMRGSKTASAAATPDVLRQSREAPRTPLSAAAWLRRSGGGGDSGFGKASSIGSAPPQPQTLLTELRCRLDLGTLGIKVPSAGGSDVSSSPLPGTPVSGSPASAFARSPPANTDWSDGAGQPASPTAVLSLQRSGSSSAGWREALGVQAVVLDFAPQPRAAGAAGPVELEGSLSWV